VVDASTYLAPGLGWLATAGAKRALSRDSQFAELTGGQVCRTGAVRHVERTLSPRRRLV